jgi:acetyl-CoA carboxylase biotin carboxyl carrier protein
MNDDNGSNGAMRVDTDLVRQLAEMLSENDLTEIEVEDGDRKISVKRTITAAPVMHAAPMAHAPAPAAAPAAAPAPAAESGPHPGSVPSPMVGTVYLSAEPGSKPFVAVGDSVSEGQTLLIIEAMKVMNQIPAPRSGTVTRICVQNAEPVEFGQALVVIE